MSTTHDTTPDHATTDAPAGQWDAMLTAEEAERDRRAEWLGSLLDLVKIYADHPELIPTDGEAIVHAFPALRSSASMAQDLVAAVGPVEVTRPSYAAAGDVQLRHRVGPHSVIVRVKDSDIGHVVTPAVEPEWAWDIPTLDGSSS